MVKSGIAFEFSNGTSCAATKNTSMGEMKNTKTNAMDVDLRKATCFKDSLF